MESMHTVRVTGKGVLHLKPDTTRISLTLTGVDPAYADALAHCEADTQAVRDALAKLEGGAGKELSAREREGYEGDIAWVVYRILQTRRDEYRGLSQAKVTEEERQKVLGYFEEEDVFLTDVLGLDEAAQDEIWKQSLTREGGYADYDKLKKALAPHLAKWFE